jgi:hypothetical protein
MPYMRALWISLGVCGLEGNRDAFPGIGLVTQQHILVCMHVRVCVHVRACLCVMGV